MKKEILQTLNTYFDHSLNKSDATVEEVKQFCKDAADYNLGTLCVNSEYVALAKKELEGKNIRITSTSGFPLGANTTPTKVFEARECALLGADELDVVMNVGRFLSGDIDYVIEDLKAVVDEFKSHGEDKLVKVIIETSLIGPANIAKAVECVVASGADFAKTTTGFGKHGARFEDVEAMVKAANGRVRIKAAGGIRTLEEVYKYIEIGATRFGGTGAVRILHEAKKYLEEE